MECCSFDHCLLLNIVFFLFFISWRWIVVNTISLFSCRKEVKDVIQALPLVTKKKLFRVCLNKFIQKHFCHTKKNNFFRKQNLVFA